MEFCFIFVRLVLVPSLYTPVLLPLSLKEAIICDCDIIRMDLDRVSLWDPFYYFILTVYFNAVLAVS